MAETSNPRTRDLRATRQIREYTDEPVSDADLAELLEVARWTGSSQNTQPWHFVVLTDPEDLGAIGASRAAIAWVASAPSAIAIVLDGKNPLSEAYDEGRVTERLLVAARMLGLGAGTAWIGSPEGEAAIAERLGVPAGRTLRSVVVVGHPVTGAAHKLGRKVSGRKPVDQVVGYGRYRA